MKKFLEDLKKELNQKHVNQEDINEIISDHEEMIESAVAKGLSDSDIIEQLGNPATLAQELAEFSGKEKALEVPQESYQMWKQFNMTDDDISIHINLISEDITVRESNSNDLMIYYKGSKNIDQYEATFEKGVFKLTVQKEFGFSFFRKFNNKISFLIEVPKIIKIEDFKFKSVSSDLHIININVQNSTASLTSGDIEIKSAELGDTQWHTVSGDMNVLDSKIKTLHASQVSGELSVKNVTIYETLELNTVSGDIELENVTCDTCGLHAVSGNINAQEFYPNSITFKSVSGDINIKNSKETNIEILKKKSVSGKINISTV